METKATHKQKIFVIILLISATIVCIATLFSIFHQKEDLRTYYQQKNSLANDTTTILDPSSLFHGKGSVYDPYLIESVDDFVTLCKVINSGNNCLNCYFKQNIDLDLSQSNLEDTFDQSSYIEFAGIYDGTGHAITGITAPQCEIDYTRFLTGVICNSEIDIVYMTNPTFFLNLDPNSAFINCIIKTPLFFSDVNITRDLFSMGNYSHCVISLNDQDITFLYSLDNHTIEQQEDITAFLNQWNQSLANQSFERIDTINYFHLTQENNNVQFSNLYTENYTLNQITQRTHLKNFFRNIFIYIISTCIVVILSLYLARKKNKNLSKCIFYGLSMMFVGLMLMASVYYIAHRQQYPIIALLYDGTTLDGILKTFTDFFDCIISGFNPYLGNNGTNTTIYPPFVSLFFAICGFFVPAEERTSSIIASQSQMGRIIYLYFIILVVFLYSYTIRKYKQGNQREKIILFCLLILSYPFLHAIERGNIVLVCPILMTIFLYNYESTSFKHRQIAFIALSMAVGIKIYPIILGILLLKKTKIYDLLSGFSWGVIINILPSIFFKTGLASIAYMVINATAYVNKQSIIGGKIDFAHLYMLIEDIFKFQNDIPYHFVRIFIICATLLIVFYSNWNHWKKYTLLLLDIILLTSFSPFYYILYLLPALMSFLDTKDKTSTTSIIYGSLFASTFMTFAFPIKYPLRYISSDPSIWSMTFIIGIVILMFETILLGDGIWSCIHKFKQRRSNIGNQTPIPQRI